jgi:cellulose synthase/poly-beta-1,6-N-acetylglucosamine synthase-like glycosyltransferase
MKIAALIPVYSEPKALVSICERLAADSFPDKEIIVVVDGDTTPSIIRALNRIEGIPGLRVISGQGHLGKAEALNRASALIKADAFLFLDNDVFLSDAPGFLDVLDAELERRDIVELPKVGIGKGFLAQMMKIEFLSNLRAAEAMANNLGANPSMNGAAFAIRKELFMNLHGFAQTIDEDMDLAGRAFLAGASFGFPSGLVVGNAVAGSPSEWAKQRKRWMTNNALWNVHYLWPCLRSSPAAAEAMLASALRFTLPWLAMVAGALPAVLIARLLNANSFWMLLSALLGAGGAGSIAVAPYERCARRYGAQLDLSAFVVYCLFYMPIVFIANIGVGLAVLVGSQPKLDWKLAHKAEHARAEARQGTAAAAFFGRISSAWLPPPKSVMLDLAYARYRAHENAQRLR